MKTADEADEMLFHRILANNNHVLQSSSRSITLAVQLEDGRPQDVATQWQRLSYVGYVYPMLYKHA